MRTHERGVGKTLSCGTGSTTSALALNELGYINASVPVTVHTKGGDLVYEGEVVLRSPVTVGLPK